jgi:hypothetical protein
MFGFNGHHVVTAVVQSNAVLTSSVPVAGWNHVAIEFQTHTVGLITATANAYVLGAYKLSSRNTSTTCSTYRIVQEDGTYSAGAGILDWEVPSFTGNRIVVCRPAARFDYIKIQFSNTATTTMDVYVHCHM